MKEDTLANIIRDLNATCTRESALIDIERIHKFGTDAIIGNREGLKVLALEILTFVQEYSGKSRSGMKAVHRPSLDPYQADPLGAVGLILDEKLKKKETQVTRSGDKTYKPPKSQRWRNLFGYALMLAVIAIFGVGTYTIALWVAELIRG